ncbi:phosphodiester glycosidase family protein [Oscillatoriales cyanobacterium LEGE 11467]|uniref:Phosphodiester glycosidase family protein n=1 Tax=Zarconia navalis LEGE 11467 TaxID=1828826 RepID=A0A928Z911_9CYAN|nr:phosphodiester glycosidase family protein [Zarconia navalis]MBE9041243.1 phosphodiester glycosidase family protein [Zarconia navalis LEGE 11467]
MQLVWRAIGLGILALPLVAYSRGYWQRPPRANLDRVLFEGVSYRREVHSRPRPLMIHTVEIDLGATGVDVLVTPGNPPLGNLEPDNLEVDARTTSEFLEEFQLQVAINANFFYPFREKTPWDYYPHSGDRANAVGLAISRGQIYSPGQEDWPALCFGGDGHARIEGGGTCPEGTLHGVAGNQAIVENGQPTNLPKKGSKKYTLYGRMAVGIDESGEKLWIIAVDDKQPGYSEGMALAELANIFVELGASAAVNLDGGGSVTLAIDDGNGNAEILNALIHAKIPMKERPIANHIGFYAR